MTDIFCRCGSVHLRVEGQPFANATCYCNSCRAASERLAPLPVSFAMADASGGTAFRMYRKDRVKIVAGNEHFAAFLLTPVSKTRRVIATCCNTPLFVEFQGGHWLSIFNGLWPDAASYRPDFLTQTSDAPAGTTLPDGVPYGALTTAGFYGRLFAAWAAMGFRAPKVTVPKMLTL